MATKNFYANITFTASAVMLCISIYLFIKPAGEYDPDSTVCENSGRINDKMTADSSESIPQDTAQLYFDLYRKVATAPYGAWLGKELIDDIFTKNDYNGIYIFLGKNEKSLKTCFMIKGGRQDIRTKLHVGDSTTYYKLDAMCPAFCDGLSTH